MDKAITFSRVFGRLKIMANYGAPNGSGSSVKTYVHNDLEIYMGARDGRKHVTFYFTKGIFEFEIMAGNEAYDALKDMEKNNKDPDYFTYFVDFLKKHSGYSTGEWATMAEIAYELGFESGKKEKIKEIKEVLDLPTY